MFFENSINFTVFVTHFSRSCQNSGFNSILNTTLGLSFVFETNSSQGISPSPTGRCKSPSPRAKASDLVRWALIKQQYRRFRAAWLKNQRKSWMEKKRKGKTGRLIGQDRIQAV